MNGLLLFGKQGSTVDIYSSQQSITLQDDDFRIVTLPANGTLVIQVTSQPSDVAFVCQALSHCVLVGSYALIIMLDVYLNSGMHIILKKSLRHGPNKAHLNAIITQPFTNYEIALTVLWILIIVVGVAVSVFHERRNAPLPPCPRHIQIWNRLVDAVVRPRSNQSSSDRATAKWK